MRLQCSLHIHASYSISQKLNVPMVPLSEPNAVGIIIAHGTQWGRGWAGEGPHTPLTLPLSGRERGGGHLRDEPRRLHLG